MFKDFDTLFFNIGLNDVINFFFSIVILDLYILCKIFYIKNFQLAKIYK